MEKLHSNSTFFRKYIFPIILLSISMGIFGVFIKIEFWIGAGIAFMIFVMLVGIIKNFYWDLKCVYLDEVNNRLIVEEKKKRFFVEFSEIEKVELVKILSIVIVVKLKREINDAYDFTFVPRSYFLFKSSIEDKLNEMIKLSTAGNRR